MAAYSRDPVRRPESFERAATDYDRFRLGYPEEVVEMVSHVAGLSRQSRLLEIGCGTGQLTRDLAKQGCELVAVEPGPSLSELARRNLAEYANVCVDTARFEDWPLPKEPFDAVVSASAFHWLSTEVRFSKTAQALRPGGRLAILHVHHVKGGTPGFFEATQPIYMKWGLSHDPFFQLTEPADAPTMYPELDAHREFISVERHRLELPRELSSEAYVGWLRTDSLVLAIDEEARTGFLRDIGELIDSSFGGKAARNFVYEVTSAERAA